MPKKLVLNCETLRTLSSVQLGQLGGGGTYYCDTNTCGVTDATCPSDTYCPTMYDTCLPTLVSVALTCNTCRCKSV